MEHDPATDVSLIESTWLRRLIRLRQPIDVNIEYNGRGIGSEAVLVNGLVVSRRTSLLWFTPRFEFVIDSPEGPIAAAVEVRVWPWLQIRKIRFTVQGDCVYSEGQW